MTIKEIVQRLKTAMDDARGEESHFQSWLTQNEGICDAIDALKELDKTEQEPVAWCVYCDGQFNLNIFRVKDVADVKKVRLDLEYPNHKRKVVPLYTSPPQRPSRSDIKPLTDEEIILIVAECASSHQHTDIHFARAIEAAHGIKEKNNG